MNKQLLRDILEMYRRHGWELRRVLLRPAALASLDEDVKAILASAKIVEADFDALWFARPSHRGREAWELRLVSKDPYALFEAFEADETEGDREDARREMEARMRERVSK